MIDTAIESLKWECYKWSNGLDCADGPPSAITMFENAYQKLQDEPTAENARAALTEILDYLHLDDCEPFLPFAKALGVRAVASSSQETPNG